MEGLGGEGLMLRQPGSRYEAGRSHTLLKVKSFHDDEARVVGHTAGAGRHKGRLGALEVELRDGTRFSVGTGLSDAGAGEPAGGRHHHHLPLPGAVRRRRAALPLVRGGAHRRRALRAHGPAQARLSRNLTFLRLRGSHGQMSPGSHPGASPCRRPTMRLKLALSAAVASLLFATPVLAEEPAPTGQEHHHGKHKHKEKNRDARMLRKLERMEHRLNRAVERGRLTREQADTFLAEARQLRDDAQAQLQAGGGQLHRGAEAAAARAQAGPAREGARGHEAHRAPGHVTRPGPVRAQAWGFSSSSSTARPAEPEPSRSAGQRAGDYFPSSAVALRIVGSPRKPENISRLGEHLPSICPPCRAWRCRRARRSRRREWRRGCARGRARRAPATCGAAMEVPLRSGWRRHR